MELDRLKSMVIMQLSRRIADRLFRYTTPEIREQQGGCEISGR